MKLIFVFLLLTVSVYSQVTITNPVSVKIDKKDADSLYYDLIETFPDITADTFKIEVQPETALVFYNANQYGSFGGFWNDLTDGTKDKILRRLKDNRLDTVK